MQELARRMASAASWGVEGVSLVTPAEIKELVPYIDESVIVGGFYSEGVGVVDSLRAGTLMREAGPGVGRPHRLGEQRGARHRRRARAGQADPHEQGRDRDGGGGDLLRRLEPAGGAHGRGLDPVDAGGSPDDRHRPRPALRRRGERDRVPDRPRHGHQHVRAPGRQRARGGLLRAPPDPPRSGRDPLGRGGRAVADGVPVHPGRLRGSDGARAGADAGDRRRRVGGDQVRDQRPALADAGRHADPRRDAGGQGALVRRRRVGQGGPRRRSRRRRVDGPRRIRDRRARRRRRPLPRVPEERRAREGARRRGLQQDLRHRPPRGAVGVGPPSPAAAVLRARARARRRVLRGRRLGATALVRVEQAAARGVRRPGLGARGGMGRALVVADHQRRAPGHA